MPRIDVDRVRADTPGTASLTHLNNAGASLSPTPVLEAQLAYLRQEAADGGYETAEAHQQTVEASYEGIGALLGAQRDEIAVVDSASRAWHLAFAALRLGAGDVVLADRAQYVSNALGLLQAAQRSGVEVVVLPNDEHGQLSVDALRERLDDRVRLVAVTHMPTSGGLINPVAEVGALTRAAGVPYLLDACQSVGQLVVDVEAIGCDFLAATARKFLRGPRGVGFLYVRRSALAGLEPESLDSGGATRSGSGCPRSPSEPSASAPRCAPGWPTSPA
jgi:selenocysteine lyase/cysteine desulfurase